LIAIRASSSGSIPATGDYPTYGLVQDDMNKLDQRCESSTHNHGDMHEWCLATRRAERVKAAHLAELTAIPKVVNIGIGARHEDPDCQHKFEVGLMLQVNCPKDVAEAEARAPKEIEGVSVYVETVAIGTDLTATTECATESDHRQKKML
jgi:hypothetical protein